MNDLYDELINYISMISKRSLQLLYQDSFNFNDINYIGKEITDVISNIIIEYVKGELDYLTKTNDSVLTIIDAYKLYDRILGYLDKFNSYLNDNYNISIDMGVMDGIDDIILLGVFESHVRQSNISVLKNLRDIIDKRLNEITLRTNRR